MGRLISSFFFLGGAAINPSRIACFRASLCMRRTASELPPRSFLRGLLVKTASPHFPEHALALHLLLEHAERLLDVVIADKYLQKVAPHVRAAKTGRVHSFER
jgi:hypothetical protein